MFPNPRLVITAATQIGKPVPREEAFAGLRTPVLQPVIVVCSDHEFQIGVVYFIHSERRCDAA